jgi:hypothetical protein
MVRTTIGKLIGLRPVGMAAVAVFAGGGLALASGSAPGTPAEPHQPSHSGAASRPAGTPHPSLHGLCHAYQAGATNNHGKALHNPAFSALVKAAGGRTGLTSYCDGLVGPRAAHGNAQHGGAAQRHQSGRGNSKHVPPGRAKKQHH